MEASLGRRPAAIALLAVTPLLVVNLASAEDNSESGRWRYVRSIQRVLERGAPADQAEDAGDAERKAAIVNSDQMLAAMSWLDHYFAVQVDYSDAEVAEFRRRLDRMSSHELRSFLADFQRERHQLKSAHGGSTARRGLALSSRYTPTRSAAHPAAPEAYFQYKVPAQQPRVRRSPVIREPLITSLDVARLVVYRYFWRR